MIFGIGIDLAKAGRFEKWVKNPEMIKRFFNENEIVPVSEDLTKTRLSALCQHYAVRFAAKEAFSKALGTGIVFDLRDVYIVKNENGKPELVVEKSALEILQKKCSDWQNAKFFVSMSHEKEFVVAQVAIEI